MHVAPDDAANVGMPIDDAEKFLCILQADTVEPTAVHRHRMVMQAHQRMPLRRAGERRMQCRQAVGAETSGGGAANGAVEEHDSPHPEIDGPADDEWRAVELTTHRLRL